MDQRPTEQDQTDASKERSMSLSPQHKKASASDEGNGLWSETHTRVQPDLGSKSSASVPDRSVGMSATGSYSSSLLDDVADFINEHLRVFRAIPWVLGGVGALLVIRYTHMVCCSFKQMVDQLLNAESLDQNVNLLCTTSTLAILLLHTYTMLITMDSSLDFIM